MNTKVIVLSLGLICASVLFVAFVLRTDVDMAFPHPPHGKFLQLPEISTNGETRNITWILPKECRYTSYEAQEIGYEPNSGMFWGGVTDASCIQTENGFACTAGLHPNMANGRGPWNIQALAHACDSGGYFISEVEIIR